MGAGGRQLVIAELARVRPSEIYTLTGTQIVGRRFSPPFYLAGSQHRRPTIIGRHPERIVTAAALSKDDSYRPTVS